jgi:hypothetical protein
MACKKHKPEEIITILFIVEIEQAKGRRLELAAKNSCVTQQTIIRWRKVYGGLPIQNSRVKSMAAKSIREKFKSRTIAKKF